MPIQVSSMRFRKSAGTLILALAGLVTLAAWQPRRTATVTFFEPFLWTSEPPPHCPFESSTDLEGIRFLGQAADFRLPDLPRFADTWYPTWGSDDNLYSSYTDGRVLRMDGGFESASSFLGERSTTGQAVMTGDSPADLTIYSLGSTPGPAKPYEGRYPCGSLMHNGVWYYGTYCLGPEPWTHYGGKVYNWPWMGPFVGFRFSTDMGRSWTRSPHTPEKPLFGETGMWGHPVKIGAPHFVDFGKNMEHSPDGKAYLVAHGADVNDDQPRFANLSWITGDQIYLIRVQPSIENMNDASKYEFFAGHDATGKALWSHDFAQIRPLLEWNNNMGCVTATYNPGLNKYLMCVTDGGTTVDKMNTYILEADQMEGPWKLVTYMKHFGEQGYFVNIPSKFISPDGRRMWLAYSGMFTNLSLGTPLERKPPGSVYGLVFQHVELVTP